MRVANPSTIITAPEHAEFRWDDLQARRTQKQAAQTYWRGRGLGGSSAVNGQIAIRPVPEDLDRWAALGCTGWDFASVLPYFCKLEADERYGAEPYHGAAGPIPIYRAPLNEWGAVDQALAESALDAGFAWAPDHNAPGALGVSPYAINSRNHERVSTNDGYIEPVRGRNNLMIRGNALVERIVFEGERAVGVELNQGRAAETVRAENVILSAGAIHTPALLQRSGVGPTGVLQDAGIDQRIELPVGENLQDHPLVSIVLQLYEQHVPAAGFRHTNCCVRYSSELDDAGPGDMMFVAMNRLGDSLGREGMDDARSGIGMFGAWVNQCNSTGSVSIQSTDPAQQPAVVENMLDDASDRRRMRDGVRRLAALAQHDAVAGIAESSYLSTGGWRGGGSKPLSIDELLALNDTDLDDVCLATAGDTQHATGTCRMGDAEDPAAVVDPHCRVRGAQNLRVIDASVMPTIPCANTHLATVMIAEKMSAELAS